MTARPEQAPWFEPFAAGFAAWFGTAGAPPRDHATAVPLLAKAASMGHGGSALLLDNVLYELAANAHMRSDDRGARSLARLALAYRTAAFWSVNDPDVEPNHESAEHWTRARRAPYEPRLWTAMDAWHTDPLAALNTFETLAIGGHPVQAFFLAGLAAEEAAERSTSPNDVDRLLQRARTNFIRSASAGNRAASKRLFAFISV